MSSKQNKNFEIVQYNFEVFCFCNDNLLYFILFLFFLYFQSIFKKLSARCTSQFVGLWPGWGCRSELRQSNSRKIYCKVGYADRENDFFDAFQNVFEKGFLQDVRHNLWVSQPGWGCCSVLQHPTTGKIYCKLGCADCEMIFKIYLRALFVLFCYFFNYALFCFIFIQSFCFNQNCLKVYFRMTIYFLEDFYGFICLFCYL